MARDLEEVYAEYNREHFGGSLPEVRVRWSRAIPYNTLGEFRWEDDGGRLKFEIALSRRVRAFDTLWRRVLLHEMAHYAVQIKHPKLPDDDETAHSAQWQKEMQRLARTGAFSDLW